MKNLAEQLHGWYLEATASLHPESFNTNAQKPYSELTDEQKYIDKYIADKISSLLQEQRQRMAKRIELEVEKWKPAYDDLQAAHIDGLQAAINIMRGEGENHD